MSNPGVSDAAGDGTDYGKSVIFNVVSHPVLRSLDPKDIIKFVDAREEYELEVEEKSKEVPSMTPASYKLCIKPHVLRSMHFMGMFDAVAPNLAVNELTSEHIQQAIQDAVTVVRKKEPDARVIEAALIGLRMPMHIEDPRMRVRQLVVDYFERMENIGYSTFKDDNPKKTVAHLTDALYPLLLKTIVTKDLEYRQSLKKYIKSFIKYVEEQAEHVDKSRETDAITKPNKKGKSNGNKGSAAGQAGNGKEAGDKSATSKGGGSQTDKRAGSNATKEKWTPICLHPKCAREKRRHFVKDCTECAYQAEKDKYFEEHRAKKKGARKVRDAEVADIEDSTLIEATFAGKAIHLVCPDSGSGINLLPPDLVAGLLSAGVDMNVNRFQSPRRYGMAVDTNEKAEEVYVECDRAIVLNVELHIRHGTTLTMRNVTWCVSTQPMKHPLLGRPLLEALRLDTREALAAACDRFHGDVDMAELMPTADYAAASVARLVSRGIFHATAFEEDAAAVEEEDMQWLDLGEDTEEDIQRAFSVMVENAQANGMSEEGCSELSSQLSEYRDVFRLRLGNDPPANVEPMEVVLEPKAKPVITKSRRYSAPQRAFISTYTGKLEEYGFIAPNPDAKWAAAPLLVPKDPPANFRLTLDYRPVNAATLSTPCRMPHIESELADVAGSTVFAKIDFCSGYWQLPLSESGQEALSFMTPNGIWKPLRTTQGAKNSAPNFRNRVEPCFVSIQENLKAWLDDFLLHHRHEQGLLQILGIFFQVCRERGLKISAKKSEMFKKEVRWCGRIINAQGFQFDPTRLSGLKNTAPPQTAGELCQYVHCMQWMRLAIPDFSARVAPLRAVLEEEYSIAGKRTRRSVKGIQLSKLSWGPECVTAFNELQDQLRQSVTLSHRKEGLALCLYTDASEEHWAGVVTQCDVEELSKPTERQVHEPLAFVSAAFKGSQLNWTTFEKEAYAIYQTFQKLDYLFICDSAHVFTDHLNLLFVYSPTSIDPNLGRHIASKVQRWGLHLARFQYTIEHVAGEKNVMADIMTRWFSGYRGNAR